MKPIKIDPEKLSDYMERTPLGALEQTVLLGLTSGPRCLISDGRMENGLQGLGKAQRAEWQEGFCQRLGLTAETLKRGVLFVKTAPEAHDD